MCILRDLAEQRNSTVLCWVGEAPLILYVPMFPWNFIFLQNEKEEGSKKRVV
jgi:hypothetical protein